MNDKSSRDAALARFHPAVQRWFHSSFDAPTRAQALGWPAISSGESTLIFAPTGSGKTLTAFLWCVDRLMFSPLPPKDRRCRVVYVSPLKALAVDIERNLRAPIVGISNVATASGESFVEPRVAIRTGDTPMSERARFLREPADILITTPESLYLILTSRSREALRSVETIIIDEIHALVPTKRGSHLALSIERIEALCETSPQRIGLSATARPLDEVARFLGGVAQVRNKTRKKSKRDAEEEIHSEFEASSSARYRRVTIVDTEEKKSLRLRVEVPVEDMARVGESTGIQSGPAGQGEERSSIWPAIHPRLLELIRARRSTIVFVNSRRLAERLAAALNELAGESIASAHHGSLARPQRVEIEDALKSGRLPAIIATSSLELGIDMGAVDLVIQIEAPPSVASGMQRIGRASHQVGAASEGIIFPKYRGDLLACATATAAMRDGRIESIRYPRNPLDVLAQQIVAMVSMDEWTADDLYDGVRRAAPYAELGRTAFEGVLDMLSGVYPSDEFAELRPRITWNRIEGTIVAREGAKRVAVVNGGTIPDRGLYGVFLAGAERGSARVGELDEEMVFESRVGETFLLGASTWRIEEITHDRVVVTPAPGEPGKMPFWKGEGAERAYAFGGEIGKLTRELAALPKKKAIDRLTKQHDLDEVAAQNLVQYIDDQKNATQSVPSDQSVVIERVVDELGDWRVIVLSPLGGRIHAPWAMAAIAKIRNERGIDVEAMWSDDGFILRFPETDAPPDSSLVIPDPDEVESLVIRQLGASALFAAKFRETAARALLLPRRRPGQRAPLWIQRKRAADLLQVAARFGSFPMLLETYREVLRDVFDLPALVETLGKIRNRTTRVTTVDTERPSPFAGSLLFRYVANYLYDGDAPLAERRAQALAIDQAQLRELLGEAELRELLDTDAILGIEREMQYLDERHRAKSADALHDLLLRIGDLARDEIAARSVSPQVAESIGDLVKQRRALRVTIAGEERFIAVEDAARYRDALGIPPPVGVPERFLESVRDPIGDLVLRYARTHGPFTIEEVAARYGVGRQLIEQAAHRFVESGRLVEGEFRPAGTQREWCDAEVLRAIRRRSLAKLRREVEPVEPAAYGRFLASWQNVTRKRHGLNGLLEAIESLQGFPIAASMLERQILPARVDDFKPSDLDTLAAAGEVVWVGLEPVGEHDGRVALYLTDHLPRLWRDRDRVGSPVQETEERVVEMLRKRGASFFPHLHDELGGGFPRELIDILWDLVWKGVITNDTFHALRSFTRTASKRDARQIARGAFRSRRTIPRAAEGRWSLVDDLVRGRKVSATEKLAALAQQLLARFGVLPREAMSLESIGGGFSSIYEVLKRLEESGKIRRGYFVSSLAATQFALPGAVDLLRAVREEPEEVQTIQIAATDPANPYGAVFKWPVDGLTRSVGASVIIVNGNLAAYIGRGEKQIHVFLPEDEPRRSLFASEIAGRFANAVHDGARRAVLLAEIDGMPAREHALAPFLIERGFVATSFGLQLRGGIGSVAESRNA